MSLFDWFRPRIRHPDPKVRRKALRSIDDIDQLRHLAQHDASHQIRGLALRRVDDLAFVASVAQNDPHEQVRLAAVRRIDDFGVVTAMARADPHASVRREAIVRITDAGALASITEEDPESHLREMALHQIQDEGVLTRVARESAHAHCREIAVKKVSDPRLHEELALSDPEPSVRSSAVRRVTSVDVLRKVLAEDSSADVQKKAGARLRKALPLLLSLKVKVDCNHCGHPVILNGPALNKRCDSCHGDLALSAKFWQKLIRLDLLPRGILTSGLEGLVNIDVDAGVGANCTSCNGTIILNSEGGQCDKCGQRESLQPLPEFLKRVRSGSSALKGRSPVGLLFATTKLDAGDDETKSISFNCSNCSDQLQLTVKMPRTVQCEYCETKQYLPEGLWRSMHPAEKKQAWYLCFGSKLR
jgi:Zn finger protein HypA/HybF involved in hydrogenase expression